MAVNVILTAILRANINQFLQGMQSAAGGVGAVAAAGKALQAAFDTFIAFKLVNLLGEAIGKLKEFIEGAIEANAIWEQQKSGLAAILMESNNIVDVHGKQLSMMEKYQRALGISSNIMEHLQIMAAEGVGTTKEYVDAFSGLAAAVSNSLKPGDDAISKTEKLTQAVVAASHILGQGILKGGQHQAVREINQLLEGRLTRINTLALDLGIFNDKKAYQDALKAGKVFDYIMGKMEAFRTAQDHLRHTFVGLQTTIQDLAQIAQRLIGGAAFENAKEFMQVFVDKFFVKGADGADHLNEGFTKTMQTLAVFLDAFLKPMKKTLQEVIDIVTDNKDVILGFLQTIIQFSGLIVDIVNFILALVKLLTGGMVDLNRLSSDSLTAIISALRGIIQFLTEIVDKIYNFLLPSFKKMNDVYNQYVAPWVNKLLNALHLNGDATKLNASRDKEAADAANTKAKALGHVNDALDKGNKLIQDNTQHWKNWVSTLKAAYANRFPEVAKSFLTNFGSGGTLSPFAGPGQMAPVTIHINGPNGPTTINAKMTPQQVAEARSHAHQTAGVMYGLQKRNSPSPSIRSGPTIQPA